MRVRPEQLISILQKNLAPVYLITGDEPLQSGEAADAVRREARKQGYKNRELLAADQGFAWQQLAFAGGTLSLFADKKMIDLRIAAGAPGTDGAQAITDYCKRTPDDTLLLITIGKLSGSSFKSRWLEAIDKIGIIVQVWPLQGRDLLRWLEQRLARRGLHADIEGLSLLATRIEGNLLAAAQEIEKLYILYGAGTLSLAQIQSAVADSSRYDVFALVDTSLAGAADRLTKVLFGLQAEGVAAPIVLWALTRETRLLLAIYHELKQGRPKDSVYKNHQVFEKRKALLDKALARLNPKILHDILMLGAKADRQIKGQEIGDCWETLLTMSFKLAGKEILFF
jgi:DNA polymerase-3 subunit delta